jgi:7-cyano-7-deazaguanine synthase in queuosine biosynthesis
MTWHVVSLAGGSDKFKPKLKSGDELLTVPFEIPGHQDTVQSSVIEVLANHSAALSPPAHDLLNAAVAAYTADVRIPRGGAFENWTRDIQLYLSVRQLGPWSKAAPTFERLLSFLTGDHWTIQARQAPRSYEFNTGKKKRREVSTIKTDTVCLFSGGLDSFIGAIDEIEKMGCTALVGHHSAGGGPTSKSQALAMAALRTAYGEDLTPFLQFWVSPPKGPERVSETSTRGRSIMFLGLGVAVASGLSAGRLVVPENGMISLNIPLTESRLGSYTTRTTHPHVMSLVRKLLDELGIDVQVDLPYRFQTKGEMISNCANPSVIRPGLKATMSCSHPGANRFTVRNPNIHCGYCIPCIIRRAAIRASVKRDPTYYAISDLSQPLTGKRGSDLRALKLALERYRERPPRIADLLVAGPLRVPDDELSEYLGVFKRGLDETRKFLTRYR